MFTSLHELTTPALTDLGKLLLAMVGSEKVSRHRLEQLLGPMAADRLDTMLASLATDGWTPRQVGVLALAIAEARRGAGDPEHVFDLVLSGPDAPGVPTRDTGAVMHELVSTARHEILLAGYAVYNGRKIFKPLAERLAGHPGIRITLCLNIERRRGDTSLPSEIVARFLSDFQARHWPWRPLPRLFYDPRAIDAEPRQRAALHAKVVLVDRKAALITSANFTEAAQKRNVEAGVLITHPPFVARLADYFDGLQRHVLSPAEPCL
jgi:phosphatidylserine/phosphatidylglycerophosphate/cardiolipin synthase-like enzyme